MSEHWLADATPTADRVFVNGTIVTVDSRDQVAEALAVAGNRILRVGARAYVEQTVGRNTQVVDLRGRALIPGMTENHIHMTNSPQREWVDCSFPRCRSVADVADLIAARARQTPPGEWVLGRGFQATRLKERRNPTRRP